MTKEVAMKNNLGLLAAVMCLVLAVQARAAEMLFATIDAVKQGPIKGDSTAMAHKGQIVVLGMSYEVVSPRDPASGMATGRVQHSPLVITKPLDSASPQLFQAAVTNELLKTVTLQFVRTTGTGQEEVFYTVKLTDVTISDLKTYTPGQDGASGERPLEKVSFTYGKIEVQSSSGKVAADDAGPQGRPGVQFVPGVRVVR
jgi:type VI secretion system secreted protein Hcp